jgi:CheY-like chemotaxis protein
VIKDTGISIPKEKQNIIFEKFICFDPSKMDFAKGFGFGLTNIKTYIKELEGEFKPIKSEKGQGTTFSFLIPMKASFNQDINAAYFSKDKHQQDDHFNRDSNHSTQPKKSQKKIISPCYRKMQLKTLIVEDSRLAQRMTESILLDLGCNVDVAGTAEEGLEMITRNTYDIIFLDLGLPGMGGIEMAKKIRQNEKSWDNSPIPIIGQSAQVDAENKKACLNSGMQELLPKPLVANIMIQLLNKYVACKEKISPPSKKTNKKRINSQHVIDKTLFNAITHNDPETQASFIALTKQLLITDFIDFKQAYHEQDWEQLLFFTHKLRGSFACIAAIRLEEVFGHLEEYLCEDNTPDIEKVQSFYDAISMEIKALQKEIATL